MRVSVSRSTLAAIVQATTANDRRCAPALGHITNSFLLNAFKPSRECCTGVLCNLARKTWMTADICKEIGMPQMFLKSMGVALAQGEEG